MPNFIYEIARHEVSQLIKAGSARMDPSLRAHTEAKGEAIQKQYLDCFVALLLAMTRALGQFQRNPL
jgi:hypothetical protein